MRNKLKRWKLQLNLHTIMLYHIRFPLFISQISIEDHFPHNQDPNIVLVIHLSIIAKHLLLNPNLLVKTRVKIPYLNQFVIIAKRQVILFLSAYI